jgi:hypothetical protein
VIATLTVDGEIAAILPVPVSRRAAAAGHAVAASVSTASERLLRIADVIRADCSGDWLRQYPGCAVAVAPAQTDTRAGSVEIQCDDPLIAGLFLHMWLTAGYPIDPLAGSEIQECQRVVREDRVAPFWATIEVR